MPQASDVYSASARRIMLVVVGGYLFHLEGPCGVVTRWIVEKGGGRTMPEARQENHRDLVKSLIQKTEATSPKTTLRYRETMTTLMLGSLSASLGLVALAGAVSGMLNRPLQEWSTQLEGPLGTFRSLSALAVLVALVGLLLGIAGVLASRNKTILSPVSVLGAGLCYITFVISLVHALSYEF